MIRRIALLLFVVGAPLFLNSCALANLLKAPFSLMNNLLNAGGRTLGGLGLGANNNARPPLRLDPGEIERAREAQGLPALKQEPAQPKQEQVAAR